VKLSRALKDINFELYAKLEALNPGGSMKDRPAISIIKHAIETGEIRLGTIIIESSSGNMGIGLAQACACFGLRFICVVDPKTTSQNVKLLRAYGAEVEMVVDPDPVSGEYLQARIHRVEALLNSLPGSYWPNQYANEYNSKAHHQTMHEVATALNKNIDYLFCATSTCGTLRGCAEYIKDNGLATTVVAVDAQGSVIFGGKKAKRLIAGHGAALRPHLFQPGLAKLYVHVSDLDCIVGCRRLARREGIMSGGSSGGVFIAVDRMRNDIADGATCVIIFPDRGERYLDTIYSDSWVKQHFGDVSYLWETAAASQLCEVTV
jgi:N-(2-amino-2-carboxyethyl)-L-glutamate synthase